MGVSCHTCLLDDLPQGLGWFTELGNPIRSILKVASFQPCKPLRQWQYAGLPFGSVKVVHDHIQRHLHEGSRVGTKSLLHWSILHTSPGGHSRHGIGKEQGEEAVQIVLPVVRDLVLILSLLGIQSLCQLALLLSCVELVLQGPDLPQVVDTQHPLRHLDDRPCLHLDSWLTIYLAHIACHLAFT